jgi:hypothetical protein
MRKLSVTVAATALALAGAGCGLQAHQSSAMTTTTARAALAGALAMAGPASAPRATSIVGTWSGYISPSPGSHASRQRFIIVVDRGERAGTWRIGARCAGTLRLKNISNGYHHFYRQAGAIAGCAPLGIDCLKRAGAQMEDEFSSDSAWGGDTVKLRRVSRRDRAGSRRLGNASTV